MKETEKEKYTKILESAMETQAKHIKLLEYTVENLQKQLKESETIIKTLESQIELQGEKKEKEKEKVLKLKPKKPKRRMKMDYTKFIEKNLLNREKFSLKEIQDEFKLSRYATYYLAGILKKDERFETSKENKLLVFKRK